MIKTILIAALLSGAAMAQDIYATFNVKADKEANLMLSSNGLVKKINVDVGDSVKKGQVLLELDSDDLKTSVILAHKQIELAEVNLRFAKKAYDRFSQVKDVVDEELFDTYASSYERSKIALANAKANLAYKRALLEKTRLKAPFSGIIASKEVEVGDGVSSAKMETLFTLITPQKLKLVVLVDEKYWQKIKVGQTFTYSVGGTDKKFTTKIAKIYPSIDPEKRAITLEMPTKGLKVGLFGHGSLKVD
ncbi:MAG: efflux RND transporter periplasmic adaptor subunit [Sulfurimonadaceae bacterium]